MNRGNFGSMKYYWFLSDGKIVREISWEEWRKMASKDMHKKSNTRLLCRIETSYISFRKGNRHIWIPLKQLRKVLENEGK